MRGVLSLRNTTSASGRFLTVLFLFVLVLIRLVPPLGICRLCGAALILQTLTLLSLAALTFLVLTTLAVGIAAGYLFDDERDPIAVEVSSYAKENGLKAALAKYSDITDEADVAMIRTFYDMFLEKAPFEKFVEVLAGMKNTH